MKKIDQNTVMLSLVCWSILIVFVLTKIQNSYTFSTFNWRYIHWLFNYKIGFVKRGLVGQALDFFNISNSYFLVSLIALTVFFVFFIVIFWFAVQQLFKDKKSEGALLFFFMMTLHSATLQHAYFDLMRFDYINYLLLFLYIFLVSRIGPIAAYIVLYLIMSTMLLVHEAAFFMFLPLMLFALLILPKKLVPITKQWPYMLAISFALFLQCYSISRIGLLPISKWDDFMYLIHNDVVGISSFDLQDGVMVIFRPLSENFNYTALHALTAYNFAFHIFLILVNMPLFFLIRYIFLSDYYAARLGDRLAIYRLIGLIASFSPLMLYPIGYDHFRWWALSLTNLFVALTLMARNQSFAAHLQYTLVSHRMMVIFGVVGLSIWCGPILDVASYEFAFQPASLVNYFYKVLTNSPDV